MVSRQTVPPRACTTDAPGISVGDDVYVAATYRGTVRFKGETEFAPGEWVGVELLEAQGKNDGMVRDVRYFTCPPLHGLFVREAVLRRTDTSGGGGSLRVSVDQGADSASDSDEAEQDEHERSLPGRISQTRRGGVSAEAAARASQHGGAPAYEPPVYAKGSDERRQLAEIIRTSHDSKMHMLFGALPAATLDKVIDAMFMKPVAHGERVIEQGDEGQFFYIAKSGGFEVFVSKQGKAPVKVYEAGAGFAFGELALLYNAPRSATVSASGESEVWCLERTAFRELVVRNSEEQFMRYVAFLKKCNIFSELDQTQIASLAEVLEEEDFEEDEAILEQGEKDDKMYILREGTAVACIRGDQGEVEVKRYGEGDFFGEIALLTGEPRRASVYALGPVTCMYIARGTFARVLGPLRDFLVRNIDKYQKYQEAITASADEEYDRGQSFIAGDNSPVMHAASGGKTERRRRSRTQKEMGQILERGVTSQVTEVGGTKSEPASLADKVAQDFNNPALVSPSDKFALSSRDLQLYGGLRPGEKFTVDKSLIMATSAGCASDGLDDLYSWNGPSWLKGSTHAAAICQKGQKSASDPTPNQDNYFIVHIGNVGIFGVCDGHGPFGHLVSFRLVQTLPYFIASSSHFGGDWESALKEAFLSAQSELVSFAEEHDIFIDASGAAGSVVVFDGACFHCAHIGDAGIMVASYNRHDSRLIYGSRDHKPNLPEEKARLEAAGSEVRELDKDNWRIYLPGSEFPGLTMSRAFGDLACNGVLREPEYKKLFVQPTDEVYMVLASDGIWEFINYEDAVELSAKKLRLKGPRETVNFLKGASRKRWAHVCGDYCDDITCMLVQWNAKDKGATTSKTSHSLAVSRHE